MALSRGVGRPIQDYIQNNILSVVGCMLRVGQFPTKSFGLCQAAAQVNFEFAENVPNTGDGGGAANNSPSEANNNNNGGEQNRTPPRPATPTQPRFRSSNETSSIDSGGGSGAPPDKTIKISNDDSGPSSIARKGFSSEPTVVVRRIRRDGQLGGGFSIAKDKKEKFADGAAQVTTSAKAVPRDLITRRPTASRFSIPKPKSDSKKGPDTGLDAGFSITNLIKWILIIGILFIVGVFLASQLNSIRKGWTD